MISTADNTNLSESQRVQCPEGIVAHQHPDIANTVAVDLCCGLGGMSLAAQKTGLQILAGVDINASALKTFSKNFPSAKKLEGSVRSTAILSECEKLFDASKAEGKRTVILSGPPCQGFSAAGSRDPADPRNQVLVAVARAITKLKPDCALVENVSMLLADKHNDRIKSFIQVLNEGGFQVTHIILNAAEFGVPQNRRRAFFLISNSPLHEKEVLSRLEAFKVEAVGAQKVLQDLPRPKVRPDDYHDERDYGTIPNHVAMQHSQAVRKKIAGIKPGTGPMSYRRLHPNRLSNTLFSGHRAPPAHYSQSRSITVREAARLQGFPDDFRIYGIFSKQMEQVTNAVPPPLTEAVLKVLLETTGAPNQ